MGAKDSSHTQDPIIRVMDDETANRRGSPRVWKSSATGEQALDKVRNDRRNPEVSTLSETPAALVAFAQDLQLQGPCSQRKGRRSSTQPPEPQGWPSELGGKSLRDSDDWMHVDIGSVLRALRTGLNNQAKLALRKLHTHWWHKATKALENISGKAGVPDMVLKLIPPIVDVYNIFRSWTKFQPKTSTTSDVFVHRDDAVDVNLMFACDYEIFHTIGRCKCWCHSLLSENRTDSVVPKP